MRRSLISIFIFFPVEFLFAQGIDNLWLMGYQCCITYFHPMNLNFNSGSLTIDTVRRTMNMNCTNGVICDANGNLLFYTNGIYIANAMDDTMQNGDNINPGPFTTTRSFYGLSIIQIQLFILDNIKASRLLQLIWLMHTIKAVHPFHPC